MWNQRNTTGIGVEIDTEGVRMAESRRGRVVRCASAPCPAGVTPESAEFPAFLKRALDEFRAKNRRAPVWAVGCPPSMQIRYLKLHAAGADSPTDMIYWTFRKDLPFDAQQTLFDYGIEHTSGSGKNRSLHVTAYTALQKEVETTKDVFEKAGITPAGIVIPPFAIRNLVQAGCVAQTGTALCLYFGDASSTLTIVRDGIVCSIRLFKTGMDAMTALALEQSPDLGRQEAYQRIIEALQGRAADEDTDTLEVIRGAFGRLVQQIERTLAAYRSEYPGDRVDRVYVTGVAAVCEILLNDLNAGLDLAVSAGLSGGAVSAPLPPECGPLETVAAGASLSSLDRTPNLLYTCRSREKIARHSWWRMLGLLLFGLGVAVAHLSHDMLKHFNEGLAGQLAAERQRVESFTPRIDRAMLETMDARALTERTTLKRMARRWIPMAALREIVERTPEDIRLMSAELSGLDTATPRARLTGMTQGERTALRPRVISYALELEGSPLFLTAALARAGDVVEGGAEALLFDMELTMDGTIGNVSK